MTKKVQRKMTEWYVYCHAIDQHMPMWDWCMDNIKAGHWWCDHVAYYLKDDEDAMAFKLRWL